MGQDLMESKDKAHMIGRRAEQTIAKYQAELSSLKAQLVSLTQSQSQSSSADETGGSGGSSEKRLKEEVQRLSETVEDLNAEIEDLKAQELKLRDAFLSDLAQLNQLNLALKEGNSLISMWFKLQGQIGHTGNTILHLLQLFLFLYEPTNGQSNRFGEQSASLDFGSFAYFG
ncbi:hypothetical protein PGT21_032918 [Puccinia graminis f. sp. tritici]|uniref:Uncharacterized protein n=1 Tax=Puccinia graminis f. sp. tritici TaxID=56615 RepID=A0A5B0NRW4_PUCGR|nr:hypothetical protein PGT21_032918 [Puccinia graminis f. sp. tritici]